jgi:hypothetical protein
MLLKVLVELLLVGLIAEVDCTDKGKALCEFQDIKSFPILKYGDPANLEEYSGGRSYEDLAAFATENLVPQCSPNNLDLCDDETKKQIEEYLAMSKEDLNGLVRAENTKLGDAKKKFDDEVEALQERYEEAAKDRDEALAAVRNGGLGLMRSVAKAKEAKAKMAKAKMAKEEENDGVADNPEL